MNRIPLALQVDADFVIVVIYPNIPLEIIVSQLSQSLFGNVPCMARAKESLPNFYHCHCAANLRRKYSFPNPGIFLLQT